MGSVGVWGVFSASSAVLMEGKRGWLWVFETRVQLPQPEVAPGWLEEVVMTKHTPRAGQAAHRDESWVIKNELGRFLSWGPQVRAFRQVSTHRGSAAACTELTTHLT